MIYKVYSFVVCYMDSDGAIKGTTVKTKDRNEDERELLLKAMDNFKDYFAKGHKITFLREEWKLSLFDRL